MSSFLQHFGLSRPPFSTTPDPAFVFASREHEQALLKIAYYTDERQGLFLLLGEVGTGKTTVAQLAASSWRSQPDKYVVGQVTDASPRTPAAFLRNVLASFGFPAKRNVLDLKATLRLFLVEEYQKGRTVVLVIDEAQTIYSTNLDTLHAMTNEQTQTQKLIQIILLAQPNFKNKLAQHPALRSRIAGVTTLDPLTWEDSIDLLRHRMSIADGDFDEIFLPSTHKRLYNATHGVPRDLCILCNATMVNAFTRGQRLVDDAIVEKTLEEYAVKEWLSDSSSDTGGIEKPSLPMIASKNGSSQGYATPHKKSLSAQSELRHSSGSTRSANRRESATV
jgi:general secretion pathway protein A